MPTRIKPCLALLQSKAPTGVNWAFEVKWDGYRLAVHRDADGVRIITRGGHDWTHRFPSIAAEAAELDAASFILDGEALFSTRPVDLTSDYCSRRSAVGAARPRPITPCSTLSTCSISTATT